MEKSNFENLRVFQLSEKLADLIWDIVLSWNHLATDTVGKQIIRSAPYSFSVECNTLRSPLTPL